MSGIVVFVVCLTGGIWVWRYEVWHFTEKYQRVEVQQKTFLAPSVLAAKAKAYLEAKEDTTVSLDDITYWKAGKTASFTFHVRNEKHASVYMNPYTGEILKDKREPAPAEKFFIFVRAGHRFFWLPQKIGSPVVGSACIVFLIILITGLIWWYPRKWTAKTREKSFKVKWSAKWKRLNIDLHNVLGFYTFLFVMLLTISGIVFTFDWFENGVYRSLTWKAKAEQVKPPLSDTTLTTLPLRHPEDRIWESAYQQYGNKIGRFAISIPEEPRDPYRVFINFGDGTVLYNNMVKYYDQKTLKELRWASERAVPYEQLSVGEKVFRMNFDIHTGQILGLPTKIIAFIACIVGASLPVTGVIIWYNRKWGKKKKNKAG